MIHITEAFNSTSRYLDDLLNIDTTYFEGMVTPIYPNELQLNNTDSNAYRMICAYLEMKIWSLLKHKHLTTGNKILWKRGEIAPKEQFLLVSTVFSIYI